MTGVESRRTTAKMAGTGESIQSAFCINLNSRVDIFDYFEIWIICDFLYSSIIYLTMQEAF